MDGFCGSQFWNSNTFWDADDPDLTICFEKTLLVWIPCAFLWIFLPLEIYFLRRSKSSDIPLNWYNISKLVAIIILAVAALNDIINNVLLAESFFPVDFYSSLIKLVTFVLFFILTYANVKFGRRSSALLFLFSLLLVIFGAAQCRTEIRGRWSRDEKSTRMEFICYVIYYSIALLIFVMNCFADSCPRISSRPIDKNACPRSQSSFLSQLLFTWLEPLVWKGHKKSLINEDLWDLDYTISSANIVPKFEKQWKKSLEKTKKTHDIRFKMKYEKNLDNATKVTYQVDKNRDEYGSIALTLFRTFGVEFLFGISLKIFHDVFIFVYPQILSLLIDFVGYNEPKWKGYFYAASLLLVGVILTVIWSQFIYVMSALGLRIRTCLISIIYKKALRISNGTRRDFTVGEMMNFMSVDASRFVDLLPYSYLLISTPLQIILAIFFLCRILGPSALAGVGVLIISTLVNFFIVSRIKLLQFKQMQKKDHRIKLMNQLLSGIKVLKLYAWEPSFEKQVLAIRNEEMEIGKRQVYLYCISMFIWSISSFLVYFATYAAYVLSSEKHVLDAKVAFVSLALFNIFKLPLLLMPQLFANAIQTIVSIRRIDQFLNSKDLSTSDVNHESRPEALIIENGSFSWNDDKDKPFLRGINLKINPGSLVAVVGPVGSGKSSLISAFLGEMYKLSGVVNSKGTVAYVPQQAWIQNASLRDNVTFGEAPSSYYSEVLEACALGPDLKIFPAADLTEIGEKGINLSGGQKQRVSLARAVYYEADIYLLDDPLSAVDSHVGKHIFEQVIGPNGLLKNKTRVLVTHSANYLSQVDSIIVMKNGSISESGTIEELLNNRGDFSEFLINHLEDNSEPDEETKKNISGLPTRQNSVKNEDSVGSCKKRKSVNKRGNSLQKRKSVDKIIPGEKLIEVEHVETKSINWNVYTYYVKCGGIFTLLAILFTNVGVQGTNSFSNMWLSKWTDDANATTPEGTQNIAKTKYYLSMYAFLGSSKAFLELLTVISVRIGCWKSAKILHNIMLFNIFRLPLSFMDVTPSGRILSRFSKDIDVVDNSLPENFRSFFFCFDEVISTLIIICFCTPMFFSVIIPLGVLYYLVQRFYVSTSRQLKRLESISRSPIYSHFLETIIGAQSIRSYGLLEKFIKQSEEKVDLNNKSYYLSVVSRRWLDLRTEMICNLIIFFAALFAVVDSDTISPGVAGLSISYTLQIVITLSRLVYISSEVETNIVSVERIKEYSEIPQEAPWQVPNETVLENWPSKGDIEFQDFKVRYREGLQLVLKGITFLVNGGQKVGIVGRTGAGKSSLTLSLFRIIESAEGKILIDGIDIASLGLHTVRSRMTIIPQDPVLFAGSLRINLDPFAEYSDDNLWRALELAHLKSHIFSLDGGLRYEITEGGENFSVGQRQQICLARALLRKTKILILDEATAAVDLETDDLIQSTIRSEFKDCTVLTIAHRLNAIMDYDKIMVIDEGYVKEYDSPQILLQLKNSVFHGMATDAGLV